MNDTPQEDRTKLFVGNLPYSTTQDELTEVFSAHGELVEVKLITDRMTGRSRGIAFVKFSSEEEAAAAIEALHGTEMEGREIIVNVARPQAPRRSYNNNRSYDSRDNRGGYNH